MSRYVDLAHNEVRGLELMLERLKVRVTSLQNEEEEIAHRIRELTSSIHVIDGILRKISK